MKRVAVFLIEFISAFFRSLGLRSCRFHPTCSCYAKEAFRNYSFLRAAGLTLRRLFRCQPFSAGGYDPLMKEN